MWFDGARIPTGNQEVLDTYNIINQSKTENGLHVSLSLIATVGENNDTSTFCGSGPLLVRSNIAHLYIAGNKSSLRV